MIDTAFHVGRRGRAARLKEYGIFLLKTREELVGHDCESWAYTILGLDHLKRQYGARRFSRDTTISGQRYIDFLLLEGSIEAIPSLENNVLVAYWHSNAPQPVCQRSGLPHYSHFAVGRTNGKVDTYLSLWGMGGDLYAHKEPFSLLSLYGDRIHIFRKTGLQNT